MAGPPRKRDHLRRLLAAASVAAALAVAACDPPPAAPGGDGGPDGRRQDAGGRPGADGANGPPTVLHIRVHDAATGLPIPAKIFLRDDATGDQLHFGNNGDGPLCAGMAASLHDIASDAGGGALATWNGIAIWRGEASIPIGVEWPVPGNSNPCADPRYGLDPAFVTVDRRESVPFGSYRILVTRGIEYEITEHAVDLSAGRGDILVDVPLNHTVDTSGYLGADMHIHSGNVDGSGSWDSLVTPENRVKTEVAAGIEVMVSSDHDYLTDLGEPIRRLWPQPGPPAPVAAIIGNEASANFGHFNAMPLTITRGAPGNGAFNAGSSTLTPQGLFDGLHALPTSPLIQVNHPRLTFAAYFNATYCNWTDITTLPGCSLDFDAIEVLNGWLACRGKIHETLNDWYAMMRLGVITTATGNSDTHGASSIIAGFPRTYVRVAQDTVAAFDEAEFIGALRRHQALATTGPFLTLRVDQQAAEGDLVTNTSGSVMVNIRMQTSTWIHVNTLRLLVDGVAVKTWALDDPSISSSLFEVSNQSVALAADAAITVEAEGSDPLPTWMVGDFLVQKVLVDICGNDANPGMIPFAVTNPVFVDADGDGLFKAETLRAPAPPLDDHGVPPPPYPADCDPTAPLRPRM
jgi:hypothetical protein